MPGTSLDKGPVLSPASAANFADANASQQKGNEFLRTLPEEALLERAFDLNKLYSISQVRESPHPQFDGMGYMKYNESNEMADMSFIAPKKNKFDTRVTSGITHEKDSSIVSLIQNFNFETNVTIFYKDRELPELSTSCTSWIRKERELMHYDEMRAINYRQLIVQGTAYALVKRIQQWVPNKVIADPNADYTDLDGISWQVMGMRCQFDGPVVELYDGKKVFLEDFHQNNIRKQPGIYLVDYVPRELLESIWLHSSRWPMVPKKSAPNGTIGAMITQGSIYSDWFFLTMDFDKMEVVQAIRPFENRYQMYINGIPMLKPGFPLTAISPSGISPLAKGDIDPMNMCIQSKGIPAKTKMDQALYDALIRIGLIKFEQSAFPPTGNNSGRNLSPDIFMPSKITRNLRKEDLSLLTDNVGLQAADFQFVNLIKEQINNKSITSMLEEGRPQGDMTLGQYLDMQKRQLIKLGGIFDGVINWEKQISHLILMDCLQNGTQTKQSVTIKDTFEDGSKGLRVLRFKKDNYSHDEAGVPTEDKLHDEELQYKKETGQDVRYMDMNPDKMRDMINNPDYYFYYEIVPVDKNNDKVTQAFFVAMITQAANIFGINSLKVQNLKQRYAKVMGEQFDDLFLSQDELDMQAQQAQQQALAAAGGAEGAQGGGAGAPVASGIAMPSGGAKVGAMYQ